MNGHFKLPYMPNQKTPSQKEFESSGLESAQNQGRDARSTLESSGSESSITWRESSGFVESLKSSGLEETFQTSVILVLPA